MAKEIVINMPLGRRRKSVPHRIDTDYSRYSRGVYSVNCAMNVVLGRGPSVLLSAATRDRGHSATTSDKRVLEYHCRQGHRRLRSVQSTFNTQSEVTTLSTYV